MRTVLLAILILLITVSLSYATREDDNTYGIGLQWVDPVAYGPSFTWEMSSLPLSFQGVLGLNHFPTPVVRARYVFAGRRFLDGYAYGAIGLYERSGNSNGLDVFGGVGAGVEWDWRDYSSDLPPVSWSLELGLNHTDVSFGFGVHYTF